MRLSTKQLIKLLEREARKMIACDACGLSRPADEIKAATYYGVEGDFCHECRHGKDCDCESN